MFPGRRYLLYFSYIGTNFRGAQRQKIVSETWGLMSVQGMLERVLGNVFVKWKYPLLKISSRTDVGTHAIMNTGHVDFDFVGFVPYPAVILSQLNKELRFLKVQHLKVNAVRRVPLDFHSRFSVHKRLYMYRLAVVRKESQHLYNNDGLAADLTPMPEMCRTHLVGPNFNPVVFKRVLDIYCGTHDFFTFMGNPTGVDPSVKTVKTLNCWIQPGQPLMDSTKCSMYQHVSDFHEVYFESRSFIYRQVRRLMGAAIRVAEGHMPFEQVWYMLKNPSRFSWDERIHVAPAHGLYLSNIYYRESDMQFNDKVRKSLKIEETAHEKYLQLKKLLKSDCAGMSRDEISKSIKSEEISN